MNNNTKKLENTLKLYLRNNNLKELKSLLDNISDKRSYLYLYYIGLYYLQLNKHHDAIIKFKEAYNTDTTSFLPLYNFDEMNKKELIKIKQITKISCMGFHN